MTNQIISREGYEKLQKELKHLITIKRREIANRIQKAKDMGDLSENAEYSEAKDAQAFNEGKIAELTQIIKNLTIVKNGGKTGTVCMGSRVIVKTNGEEKQFTIVSFNEADPAEGKISNESPLGRSFLDKSKGAKIMVNTPRGEAEYEIIDIN